MDNIIYQLIVEDVQTVAQGEIGRDLTENEIEKIRERIGDNIAWYEAIASAIHEFIDLDDEG